MSGKNVDDHLFYVPWPTLAELERLNPDVQAMAMALRAEDDLRRIHHNLSVSPELISHER